MAHAIDALMDGRVFGKLIVYDLDEGTRVRCEAYIDGGDHWNIYEPTRQQAAALLKLWRRGPFVLERSWY